MFKSVGTISQRGRKSRPIWILVADSGRARLLECATGPDGELTEIEDFLNPAARLQEHERVADRQGAAGPGQSFQARHTQADNEAEQFARELCGKLAAARQNGKFGALYLIAEPTFLGRFRKHLDPATRLLIREEISSDLTRKPLAEIRRVLPARV